MKRVTLLTAPILALLLLGAGCGETIGQKVDESVNDAKDSAVESAESGLNAAGEAVAEAAMEKQLKEQGEDADVDVNDSTVEITTDEGQFVVGGDIDLPSDFDSSIPMYEGATITTASANAAKKEYSASMNTDDAYGDVVAYYEAALAADGWELTSNDKVELGGTGLTTLAGTGHGLKLNVTITNGASFGDGETQIVLGAEAVE